VEVWCFKAAGGLWALSGDASGANLPAGLGPWCFHQIADLQGEADDEREAIELIEEHEFCCFQSEPCFLKRRSGTAMRGDLTLDADRTGRTGHSGGDVPVDFRITNPRFRILAAQIGANLKVLRRSSESVEAESCATDRPISSGNPVRVIFRKPHCFVEVQSGT
jgi:hypothetical protein